MPPGYYRFPTLHQDTVVFVSEDDLWSVPAEGGLARRLTASPARIAYPHFSPDGQQIAYLGREEGAEDIYLLPVEGGEARRLTFIASRLGRNAGWTPEGRIVFSCNWRKPILRWVELYSVDPAGGEPQALNLGPARSIAYGPNGAQVIGRNTDDPRHWKRDRGGTIGRLWVDASGSGQFQPLIDLAGDLGAPLWIGQRIYFLSDHEGIGNLYSCLPNGQDLRRHTHHSDYYACNAATDGRRIVYHAGAELYVYDPATNRTARIAVQYRSARSQRRRKFVSAGRYLDSWTLSADGQQIALTTRGRAFAFANWRGAVFAPGEAQGVRFRHAHWLNDGQRLIALTDGTGEERFAILRADGAQPPVLLPELDIGRVTQVGVNPRHDLIAFTNQRHELFTLDLDSGELRLLARGTAKTTRGDRWTVGRRYTFEWSPDGEWLAYSLTLSTHHSALSLWQRATGQHFRLTQPLLRDEAPSFDPQGRYLCFLSYRTFNPVADNTHFEISFPNGIRPYLIPLRRDLPSPFGLAAGTDGAASAGAALHIDTEGLTERVVAFPLEDGQYGRIFGIMGDKVVYSRYPIKGLFDSDWEVMPYPKGALYVYDLTTREEKLLAQPIDDFAISRDKSAVLYRLDERLRVIRLDHPPEADAGDAPGPQSGWLDLNRVKVEAHPAAEWSQMLREAWRLQRDHYWTADMSQVDWQAVYARYAPLVARVNCRSELSALIWEMQSELGIGHAYEDGGDYAQGPDYAQGYLGADYAYDPARGGWRITHVVRGDSWQERYNSPLNAPGLNIQVGDCLLAINGRRLGAALSPGAALVNMAGCEVALTLADEQGSTRLVTVKALADEMPARYREWVNANRAHVHEATNGRVGYLHLPDMEVEGYAEFHRGYLQEIHREALIVDARYNTGGYVSALILEKLRRRRTGYVNPRWGTPDGYPADTLIGPLVALCNEFTGSDGDIFAHNFKLMGLGPLIGRRTWGGVIGIAPRNPLVDGTITTQPEHAYWFADVGWGIENHGTEPDIEVENRPQDYAQGRDPQLERAIAEVLALLEANPPTLPDFSAKPDRRPPTLPPP